MMAQWLHRKLAAQQLLLKCTIVYLSCAARAASSSSSTSTSSSSSAKAPRVAIVGGGIGGASAAHFLNDLFQRRAQLHVYDDGQQLGGRMASLELTGRLFESGGSIIHDKNVYMRYFADKLQLQRHSASEEMRIAVLDGTQEAALDTSDWYFIKMLQLLHRYGVSCFSKLKHVVDAMMSDFSRIYTHQNQGIAFTNLQDLMTAMSPRFVQMAQKSIEDYLVEEGFPQNFIQELVAGAMRNNYGQNVSIHAFVGAVSLAGAEGGLWSVRGGNRQIVQGIVSQLQNELQQLFQLRAARVSSISSVGTQWRVATVDGSSDDYDFVIIATPCHQNFNIHVQGASIKKTEFHQTVATFVKGRLNHTALRLQSRSTRYNLFTGTPLAEIPFNSIGYQFDVNGEPSDTVYKLFSQHQLTDDQLHSLFTKVTSVKHKQWLAYPKYSTPQQLDAGFVIAPGLLHINPIELAASAMEMSALSGRNAALLVKHFWQNNSHLIDPKLPIAVQPSNRVLLRATEL